MLIGHYLDLVRQYRRLVLAISLGIFVASTAIAMAQVLLMPVYTATASVTVLPTSAELSYSRRFVSDGDGGADPAAVMMQTHIENLFSRPVAELTLELLSQNRDAGPPEIEAGLLQRLAKQAIGSMQVLYQLVNSGTVAEVSPYDRAVGAIQEAISVDWVQGSYILRVSARANTPEKAAGIANSLSQAYVERSRQVAGEAAAAVRHYLEEEASKRQTRLGPEGINDLRRRLVDIELSRSAGLGQVRIIDPAVAPLRPSAKIVPLSVGGAVAGALSAILVVIALDIFGGTARTSMDMTRIVGHRFLGRVPPPLALSACQQPPSGQLPLQSGTRFATGVTGRIGITSNASDQLWVHVIGIGGQHTARQGAIAIAAAFAICDMPTDVILGEERYRVRRESRGLRIQPLASDELLGSGPIVTAGPLLTHRPALLTDSREPADEADESHPQVFTAEVEDVVSRPLIIIAVAAGQVHEELLAAMAVEGDSGERLFLLVA